MDHILTLEQEIVKFENYVQKVMTLEEIEVMLNNINDNDVENVDQLLGYKTAVDAVYAGIDDAPALPTLESHTDPKAYLVLTQESVGSVIKQGIETIKLWLQKLYEMMVNVYQHLFVGFDKTEAKWKALASQPITGDLYTLENIPYKEKICDDGGKATVGFLIKVLEDHKGMITICLPTVIANFKAIFDSKDITGRANSIDFNVFKPYRGLDWKVDLQSRDFKIAGTEHKRLYPLYTITRIEKDVKNEVSLTSNKNDLNKLMANGVEVARLLNTSRKNLSGSNSAIGVLKQLKGTVNETKLTNRLGDELQKTHDSITKELTRAELSNLLSTVPKVLKNILSDIRYIGATVNSLLH